MDERDKYIEQFKQYLERRAPGRRTSIDYVSDVRQFALFCTKPWFEVTMHDIDTFVDKQRQNGLSGATIKRRVAGLKVFFDFLAEESGQLCWPNPVRFKRHAGKQPKRLPRDLSNDQVAQLWGQISLARDRAWFVLMLRAGLRVSEVVRLKLNDLLSPPTGDQPARLRVTGKGQKERVVLLTSDAYAVLQEWLRERPVREHDLIFLNDRQQPLTANGIEWLLGRYAQAVDLKVTPHQLRHTYARQLTEGGMPLASLGQLLGHAQLSTTTIYTAGADPELVQAYQTAMAHLANQVLPGGGPPEPDPAQPLSVSTSLPAPEISEPPPPDWAEWAPDLPSGLRQASLAFVQRRYSTWKAQRRRQQALHLLGYFRRFWNWQLAYRPISQPVELRLSDLQAYQQDQAQAGKAPMTINRAVAHILALWRDLLDQGQPVDPAIARLRELPRPDSLPRYLNETDMHGLESFVGQRLGQPDPLVRLENACFFVLAHTGIRASECVDLRRQDLDLAGRRLLIRQGKGQRDRVVYLSDLATTALIHYLVEIHLTPTSPLFIRPTGKPITYSWLRQHIVALGPAAGDIAVSPHRLRHTLATRLLNAGMKETAIQKILGHEQLSTTMIYARILDKTVETDYQQAMRQIESQQMPLSRTSDLVTNWPTPEFMPAQVTVNDSV
jgi:site-specific recombinase XerD